RSRRKWRRTERLGAQAHRRVDGARERSRAPVVSALVVVAAWCLAPLNGVGGEGWGRGCRGGASPAILQGDLATFSQGSCRPSISPAGPAAATWNQTRARP